MTLAADGAGCAAMRRACGEPLAATAPEGAAVWLLLEHPGPWAASGLPPGVSPDAVRVWQAASRAGVRCQLIRPVQERRSTPATVFAAGTRQGGGWVERRTVDDLGQLVDLDLAALAEGRPPGFGTVSDDRVVLVCTHGRRDVCCARTGRPVSVRLGRRLPGMVWETSHVGGHRFAANVVTLPDGSYHGGVASGDVDHLADAVLSGRVVPARLRGRAGLPAAVQAADYYARIRCGVQRLDGIVPIRQEPVGVGETVRVVLGVEGAGRYDVYVRPRQLAEVRPTSCDGSRNGARTTFDLVAMVRQDESRRIGRTAAAARSGGWL